MFFKRDKKETEKLNSLITTSFYKVRQDTELVFQWLEYLQSENQKKEEQISQLKKQLSVIPSSKEDIKGIIDSYFSYEFLLDRIKKLEYQVHDFSVKSSVRLEPEIKEKKHVGKEKMIKKIVRNSKNYVKGIILSFIEKHGRLSGSDLRDMVVEDQGLCSKSSFYRLLEELESEGNIGCVQKGKDKFYLAKSIANV